VPTDVNRSANVVTLPDNRKIWRVKFSSPGAAGLRLHFVNFHVGAGKLWVYAPQESGERYSEGPYSGDGPFGDGDVWTGITPGSQIVVEFVAADSGQSIEPSFQIDYLTHLWKIPGAIEPDAASGTAAPCELDVTCSPNYQSTAQGIVLLVFTADDGGVLTCSGAIVNTRGASFKPYLLTANHCISSETEARSVAVAFFDQTASCNGALRPTSSIPIQSGAHFLVGSPIEQGDYTLLLLSSNVPGGTTFLGWNANDPVVGDSVVGIHHPNGSWKRISFGIRTVDQATTVTSEGGKSALAPANLFYRINWTQGRTEGGSSGSPLLNSQQQIVGTLTAGSIPPPGGTVCDISSFISVYGRFSNAYPALKPWLEDSAPASITGTPSLLTFTVNSGQYVGASQQSFNITTSSATPIAYSLATSQPWIALGNTTGTVSASAPASVAVGINLAYFSTSANVSGTITVSSGSLTPTLVTVQANVTVSASKISISVIPNPVYQQPPDVDGYAWPFSLTLTESAGVGTTLTTFKAGGVDLSTSISAFFGNNKIPAGGSLTAKLRYKSLNVPLNIAFEVDGADTGGRTWTAQTAAPFLPPNVVSPPAPVITSVVNGASFLPIIASNSWITIRGTNLATTARTWDAQREIINGVLPTKLDGVSVTINGEPATVYYISPTQINVLVPFDLTVSPTFLLATVGVKVSNANGSSAAFLANNRTYSPAFFVFDPAGGRYPAATNADGSLLGPAGLFGSAPQTKPAAPGSIIVLYGTGFGPTKLFVPSDRVFTGAAEFSNSVNVTIGGKAATVKFAGMTGSGLCQLNVIVPDIQDGDQPVVAVVDGVQSRSGVFVAVHR
jgi:uncharacterized protein (TIGR03437 family)